MIFIKKNSIENIRYISLGIVKPDFIVSRSMLTIAKENL